MLEIDTPVQCLVPGCLNHPSVQLARRKQRYGSRICPHPPLKQPPRTQVQHQNSDRACCVEPFPDQDIRSGVCSKARDTGYGVRYSKGVAFWKARIRSGFLCRCWVGWLRFQGQIGIGLQNNLAVRFLINNSGQMLARYGPASSLPKQGLQSTEIQPHIKHMIQRRPALTNRHARSALFVLRPVTRRISARMIYYINPLNQLGDYVCSDSIVQCAIYIQPWIGSRHQGEN